MIISLLLFATVIIYAEEYAEFKKQMHDAFQRHKDIAETGQDDSSIPEREYSGDKCFFDVNLKYSDDMAFFRKLFQ